MPIALRMYTLLSSAIKVSESGENVAYKELLCSLRLDTYKQAHTCALNQGFGNVWKNKEASGDISVH